MKICISKELKAMNSETSLGILHYQAEVIKSPKHLLDEFEKEIKRLENAYIIEEIAQNPHIKSTREAYRIFGKNPQHYRNAAEAMLRRIVKGQGLYHINNIVEINNLISVSSGYSIGSYDVENLQGTITLKLAPEDSHYEGIGKGSVNIGHLPVLYDDLGPVGNPTSDSRRAMIQQGKKEIISVLYSFDGTQELHLWMQKFSDYLKKYCNVTEVEMWTI